MNPLEKTLIQTADPYKTYSQQQQVSCKISNKATYETLNALTSGLPLIRSEIDKKCGYGIYTKE